MVVLAGARRVGLGLGRPGVITSEFRLSRTKYINLHGGGMGAGPGDGAGETPIPRPGLPGGQRPGVLCQVPPNPTQAQT